MFKNIMLGILGLLIMVVAYGFIDFKARHFAIGYYHGFQNYRALSAAFASDPKCKNEEAVEACIEKGIKTSGGIKFGADVVFANLFLSLKKASYEEYLRATATIATQIVPENFWINSVKGKKAQRLFKQEKAELVKLLAKQKEMIDSSLAQARYPSSQMEERAVISILENKIAELEK